MCFSIFLSLWFAWFGKIVCELTIPFHCLKESSLGPMESLTLMGNHWGFAK